MSTNRIKNFIVHSLVVTMSCYFHSVFAALATCTVSTTLPVSFGNYNPFNLTPIDTTGTIHVSCTALLAGGLVNYTVTLNPGLYGTFATREMANGSYRLNYNIYKDATRLSVWGDGTSGTSTNTGSCLLVIGGNCAADFSAYGRLPAEQNAGVGAYADTVTVTITY